jgi:hypothetical protein
MTSTALLAFGVFGFALAYLETRDLGLIWQNAWFGFLLGAFMTAVMAVLMGFMSLSFNKYDHQKSRRKNIARWMRMQRQGYEFIVQMNAVVMAWMAISSSAKGLGWLIMNTPRFTKVAFMGIVAFVVDIAQFVARVFVYVHSSRRTLCFVDATLGAAIGYTYGSAIIGAVAGVILGVVNYELISVRWLKLAPQTTR